YREALRITVSRGDRGILADLQASLAEVLAAQGKVDEAERLALEVEVTLRPEDPQHKITVLATMAAVRAAQGRDDEAEELYRSAMAAIATSGFAVLELELLERLVRFYRERDREDEAAVCEARMAERVPSEASRAERIA